MLIRNGLKRQLKSDVPVEQRKRTTILSEHTEGNERETSCLKDPRTRNKICILNWLSQLLSQDKCPVATGSSSTVSISQSQLQMGLEVVAGSASCGRGKKKFAASRRMKQQSQLATAREVSPVFRDGPLLTVAYFHSCYRHLFNNLFGYT